MRDGEDTCRCIIQQTGASEKVQTSGVNFLNSETQLGSVERGAATRNGPFTPISMRWAITAITCRVFPRPISSARMPFTPFSYSTCRYMYMYMYMYMSSTHHSQLPGWASSVYFYFHIFYCYSIFNVCLCVRVFSKPLQLRVCVCV